MPQYPHHCTFTNEIHSKNLRSTEKFSLYIPKPNVEIFHKTFAYSGTDIWKYLPLDVLLYCCICSILYVVVVIESPM